MKVSALQKKILPVSVGFINKSMVTQSIHHDHHHHLLLWHGLATSLVRIRLLYALKCMWWPNDETGR
jgi:hypothetical protein